MQYSVLSEGKYIGTSTQTSLIIDHPGGPTRQVTTDTNLRVKALLFTVFSLDSSDTSLIDQQGLLEHHSRSVIDDDEIIIHAQRHENTFNFQLKQGDQWHRWAVSLADFDCSSLEWELLDSLQPGDSRVLNVLQLETLEIEKLKFTRLDDETLNVGSQSPLCRVFDWEGQSYNGRRWFLPHTLKTIVRDDGTDEDGPYSFVLNQIPDLTVSEHPATGENHDR